MDFNLVNLVITVQTVNETAFLSWLQKSSCNFSQTCKSNVCRWPARTCELCSNREMCAWYIVFSQKLSADLSALKRHQKPPLPFILSVPIADNFSNKTVLLECSLVVIGRAIPHLEMLLEGFAGLLAADSCPVPANIVRIESLNYQGERQLLGTVSNVTRSEQLAVLSTDGLLHLSPWECKGLGIRIQSPLRLIDAGRLLVRFDFSRFARSVMRRVSSLAYYYGECEYDCDFKELSRQAEAISCTDDHFYQSSAGDRRTSGILGYGSFIGDFSGLMPFLVLGEYVHAGKSAASGMGRYELLFH